MTEFYNRSNGTRARIADMPIFHAEPALAKLVREREDDSRDDEIESLSAHIAAATEAELESEASQ